MATLHSITSGNFTSATTWGVVDPTSLLDSRSGTTGNVTTTQTNTSVAFIPGAITIIGVSIQIVGRTSNVSGTVTMRLWNNTVGTAVKDVTINFFDLPDTGNAGAAYIGWTYFKFDVPVTLLAGNQYAIRMFSSVNGVIQVYTNGTVNNYSRALITSTTAAPVATDVIIISGEHTTPGTFTPYTVTMNLTSVTTYGQFYIGSRGTLTYGTASNTNYFLTLTGFLNVGAGGNFTIGTSINPIPSTSTATLQLTCTTALQFQILVYGTMTTYGATKSIATKLAADVIVGATNSTTTTTTNWSNGDLIVVPSTTRTYTQYELRTLSATASGTTLTHNAYVNAHGGNATTRAQADVVNLTRNIIIRSTTGTLLTNKTNIQMFPRSVTSFYYTAFLALGTSTSITGAGICVNTLTTGTFDFQYNVVREIVTQAATTTANSGLVTDNTANGITISNNVFYLLGWTATVGSTILASINDNNYFMGCLSTTQVINANFVGSGNVFTSNNTPASIVAFYNNSSNCSFYSNNTVGLAMSLSSSLTTVNNNLSNFRFWANNTNGMQLITSANTYGRENILSFTGSYFFGNTTASINVLTRLVLKVYFSNSFFYGFAGVTGQQTIHYTGTAIPVDSIYYDSCYFGYSNSSLTSTPFGGVNLSLPTSSNYQLFSNCYFNTANGEISVLAGYPYTNLYGGYRSLNHNGVTGSNKEWTHSGTITTDTTIFLSTPESTRLTPNSSLYKLISPIVRVPVKSGTTCTISVNVRKSVYADSNTTAYNGAQPRLMYSFNPILGNFTELVGTTMSYINNPIQSPQNFENWTKPNATHIAGATAAPDGTLTGTAHVPNTTPGVQHAFTSNPAITYTAGVTYTVSIYAKKGTQNNIALTMDFTTFGSAWRTAVFNLNTGTLVSNNNNSGITPTITSVGNGWYRCTFTNTATSNTSAFISIDRQFNNYTGDNLVSFYVWGAMQNIGTTASVYYDNVGYWENMSYTTDTFSNDGIAEFYVDCSSTAGFINIDDWNTTTANDSRGQDYWGVSGVYIEPTYRNPTRASGYIT